MRHEPILDVVCEITGVPRRQLLGRRKSRSIARARALGYYWLRHYGWSLPEIGRIFDRDPATIRTTIEQIPVYLDEEPIVADAMQRIEDRLLGCPSVREVVERWRDQEIPSRLAQQISAQAWEQLITDLGGT